MMTFSIIVVVDSFHDWSEFVCLFTFFVFSNVYTETWEMVCSTCSDSMANLLSSAEGKTPLSFDAKRWSRQQLGSNQWLKRHKKPCVLTNVLHPWIYTPRIRLPIEANGWIWATSPSSKPLREFCFHNKSPQFDFSFSFYYQIQTSLKFLELFWAQNSVAETRIFTNISLCHTEFIVTFPRRVIDDCCLVHENCGLGSTLLPLKPGQSL